MVAAADRPTAGDVGYELLMNAWDGPTVSWAAEPRGELDFIMGQLMVCRRQALDAVGGVGVAEGQFVDDMYIGRALWNTGWKNVVIGRRCGLSSAAWAPSSSSGTFRRLDPLQRGRPLLPLHLAELGARRLLLGGVGRARGGARHGERRAAGAALLAIAFSVYTQASLQRAYHGPRIRLHQLWVPAVLPLVGGLVQIAAKLNRRVDWRGRNDDLGCRGPARGERLVGGGGDVSGKRECPVLDGARHRGTQVGHRRGDQPGSGPHGPPWTPDCAHPARAQRHQPVDHHPRVLPGHHRHAGLARREQRHGDARSGGRMLPERGRGRSAMPPLTRVTADASYSAEASAMRVRFAGRRARAYAASALGTSLSALAMAPWSTWASRTADAIPLALSG